MISVRISIGGLLAFVLLAAGRVSSQDFNERLAAWQGRAPGARMVAQTTPAPEVGGAGEASPSAAPAAQQRILGDVYNAPLHTPDYNRPWTSSPCATCSHNPTFVPGSDPYGTCNYGGGGQLMGSYGPGLGMNGGGYGGGSCGAGACGIEGCGAGGCGVEGCGGGNCCACGGAGGGCDWGPLCANPLVWARFEVLMWWRQGRDLPPLVTTDPTTESSTTAGVLPDAQTLFGGGRVAANMQACGRIDFGFFTNPTQCFGIGDRIFGLSKDATNFSVASNNVPVLAVPFFDRAAGANDAALIAFPGLRTGSINASATSSLLGNDVYFRYLMCRDCNHRLDFITGWNYTRVADEVQLRTRSTVTEIGGTIPVGTVSTTLDAFTSHNDFNGGILGLLWQRNCGVWSTQLLTRTSLGNMHETMIINGSSRVAVPGQTPTTTTGGILTAASNIGRESRNEFTAISELGYNLSYRFAPNTQITVGYTLLYFSDILQAGRGIDTFVGTSGGTTRPQFVFRHSDMWVQGLNLGLTKEF
jgi:Putative beta barrel porin-7 (BBP7)